MWHAPWFTARRSLTARPDPGGLSFPAQSQEYGRWLPGSDVERPSHVVKEAAFSLSKQGHWMNLLYRHTFNNNSELFLYTSLLSTLHEFIPHEIPVHPFTVLMKSLSLREAWCLT